MKFLSSTRKSFFFPWVRAPAFGLDCTSFSLVGRSLVHVLIGYVNSDQIIGPIATINRIVDGQPVV